MSTISSSATTTLYINGRPAQDELAHLRSELDKYKKQLLDIAKDPSRGLGSQDWNNALKQVKDTEKALGQVRSQMANVTQVLTRLDKASPKELRQTLRQLNKELEGIERGSKAWDEQVKKIRAVKDELAKVKSEVREHESLWSRFANKMFQWGSALQVVMAGITGITLTARRAVDAYAEMDQEMANVRKYTGMTADQVADLNEEFKKIDTRTPREDLNKLAQEAGRLGKQSKEDVLGFVRAADQINVALDELGEGATLTLSKIAGAFGDEDKYGTEQALLKTGSVINELSQNCRASAPFLAEFTQRLTGAGTTAKMTTPQLMAFGAVLDSNGAQLESSATALGQIIIKLYRDPAKYAAAAGMDVQKFTKLLKTDANEAVLTFLDTLHKAGDLDVLAPMLADMGEKGSRSVQTLTMLAGKIDEVRAQQVAANQAFEEGTSVTREFDVQNNTVQAKLEKAKNNFNEMAVALGEKLAPAMTYAVTSSAALLKGLSAVVSFISNHKQAIINLAIAITGYTLAVNAATVATKLHAVATATAKGLMAIYHAIVAAGTVIQKGYTYAVGLARVAVILFKDGLVAARIAFAALNATMKANFFGLILAAVTTVALAIYNLTNRTKELTKAEKDLKQLNEELAESRKRYADRLDKEKSRVKELVEVARDDKASLNDRHKAINALNQLIPNYCAKLDAETGKYRENKKALDEYLLSLEKKIRMEANRAEYERLIQEDERLNREIQEEEQMLRGSVQGSVNTHGGNSYTMRAEVAHAYGASLGLDGQVHNVPDSKSLKQKRGEQLVVQTKIKRLIDYAGGRSKLLAEDAENPSGDTSTTGGGGSSGGKGGKGGKGKTGKTTSGKTKSEDKFKAEKEWRAEQDALNKIAYLNGEQNYEQYTRRMDEIAVQFYERQLARTDLTRTERLSIEAQYYEASQKQLATFNAQTVEKENAAYAERQGELKQAYLDNKLTLDEYNSQMEAAELEHLRRLAAIYDSITTGEAAKQMAGSEMQRRFKGNVDLLNRPVIDAYKLTQAGWAGNPDKEGEGVATVYSSQYGITDAAGNKREILVTPILPDGTVLSEKELEQYVYKTLQGTNDILAADDKGIVIAVDVSADGQAGEVLHQLQDIYYAPKESNDPKDAQAAAQAQTNYQQKLIADQQKRQQQAEENQKKHLERLADAWQQYFVTDEEKKQEQYKLGLSLLQQTYDAEVKAAAGNAEAKLEIDKRYAEARKKLHDEIFKDEQKGQKSWEDWIGEAMDKIFGEGTWGQWGETVKNAIASVSSMMQSLNQLAEAEAEARIARLEKRYDVEISMAEGNNRKVKALERKKERETARIKAEAQRKEFAQQVFSAVSSTALAAINAYSSAAKIAWWLGPVAAGLALAAGAVQIAAIKQQQEASAAKGFSEGGFTPAGPKDKAVGVVHAGEWVASQKLLANPVARPMIEALDYAQRNNTLGSLRAGDVSRSVTAPAVIAGAAAGGQNERLMVAVATALGNYDGTMSRLTDRLNEPFVTVNTVTGDMGIKEAQDEYQRLMNNTLPKSKRK